MKVHYYSISTLVPNDETRYIFIPKVGTISTSSTAGEFSNADDLRARFDKNPEHLKETERKIKSLRKGEKINNYRYIGCVDLNDSIFYPLLNIKTEHERLGKLADKEIKDLEKIVKEQLNIV